MFSLVLQVDESKGRVFVMRSTSWIYLAVNICPKTEKSYNDTVHHDNVTTKTNHNTRILHQYDNNQSKNNPKKKNDAFHQTTNPTHSNDYYILYNIL
eukprot:12572566-Ditylum_brightwellii.AAC.1